MILIAGIISFTSCISKYKPLAGTYANECRLYGHPEYILQINNDSTYSRIHPYLRGISYTGKWDLKSDTLRMSDQYEIIGGIKEPINAEERFFRTDYIYIRKKNSLIDISAKEKWCKLNRK